MKDPQDRLDREIKTRFTQDHYTVMAWWAKQSGVCPSEFIRQCALERMAQLAALSASSEARKGRMRDSNDKDVRRVPTQWTETEREFMAMEAKARGIPIEDVPAVLTMELLATKAKALLPKIAPVNVRHLRIVR